MRERKGVKKANKDTKKANTLQLYDGAIAKASCVYKTDTKMLETQDIDINKTKVSKEKLYSKEHKAYKNYILYDYDGEIILLLIRFSEITGRYKVFKDGKTMNLRLDDDELIENMLATK